MLTLNNNSKTEKPRSARHGYRWWSVGVMLFTIGLVGASTWRLNTELRAQGSSIAKLLGMQKTVDSLSQRMIGTETALSSFPAEMNKVTGRVDALDKKVNAVQKIATAKPAVVVAAAPPQESPKIAALTDQIAKLQTQHEEDVVQMESLKSELANTREQTSLQFAALKSEIPLDAMPDVASLRMGISSLADKMDRDRHDFEIREDRVAELLPGVMLTIKDTNVGRQEISGWIYLENEHRVVYLKDHGLLQPITVYGVYGKESHEIVITRVRKDDAIGFVLSPKKEVAMSAGN